jgi:hypothetical protein
MEARDVALEDCRGPSFTLINRQGAFSCARPTDGRKPRVQGVVPCAAGGGVHFEVR